MLPLRMHNGGVDVGLCLGRIRQRWCQEGMKVCALNPVVAEEWGSPDDLSDDVALSLSLWGLCPGIRSPDVTTKRGLER